MKKLFLLLALWVLAFATFSCAGKMVFEKNHELYVIKDDGTEMSGAIHPTPSPAPGEKFGFPDVSHDGSTVAFIANTTGLDYGSLYAMNLSGTGAQPLTTPVAAMPRWYPDRSAIAYFSGSQGICRVPSNQSPPAPGQRICDTGSLDNMGFDINTPVGGALQLIVSSRRGTIPLHYRLLRLKPSNCDWMPIPPVAAQLGVVESEINETYPAISISQDILVSVVRWDGNFGIRMRGINQTGEVTPFPITLKLQGFPFSRITGLSMAGDSNAIYFSAQEGMGNFRVYVIAAKEYVAILRNMISTPPGVPPPTANVTPTRLNTGSGDSRWPSGINEP